MDLKRKGKKCRYNIIVVVVVVVVVVVIKLFKCTKIDKYNFLSLEDLYWRILPWMLPIRGMIWITIFLSRVKECTKSLQVEEEEEEKMAAKKNKKRKEKELFLFPSETLANKIEMNKQDLKK